MMKQENLFKKLGSILTELNEQYEFLAQNPTQLNELELELFHANADFLADHVQIIKKLNTNVTPLALPAITEVAQPNFINEDLPEVEESDLNVFTNDNVSPKIIIDEDEEDSPEEKIEEGYLAVEEAESVNIETEEPIIVPNGNYKLGNKFMEEGVENPTVEPELFKLDQSPSTFEFILSEGTDKDTFDFEDKPLNEIFDRPLSTEEQQILEQKKKLNEKLEVEVLEEIEDEVGPEPFLVIKEEATEIKAEFPIETTDLKLVEADEAIVEKVEAPVEDPNYKPTLNDILAGKTSNNSVNLNATAEIKDLKRSVSLNDKLLYIKDLFGGYNLAYAEAIDLANKLPNFEAADNFFQKNYAAKNNWADKQATVDKFYRLLNERFKM